MGFLVEKQKNKQTHEEKMRMFPITRAECEYTVTAHHKHQQYCRIQKEKERKRGKCYTYANANKTPVRDTIPATALGSASARQPRAHPRNSGKRAFCMSGLVVRRATTMAAAWWRAIVFNDNGDDECKGG